MADGQGSGSADQDMDVIGWDGGAEGQELDSDFRTGECLEVEFEDDDLPDDGEDMGDDEEIGVIPENEIYSDEDTGPQVDDSLVNCSALVSLFACIRVGQSKPAGNSEGGPFRKRSLRRDQPNQ
eukprot:symbB.v1.2.005759.t1/scaffold289.1/size287290/4